MAVRIDFKDIHYCSVTSQSNVYGLCEVEDDSNVVLLAASQGKILSLAYQVDGDELVPLCKYIHFPFVPADADIVSIDACSSLGSSGKACHYVALTFIKSGEEGVNRFLSFYPDWKVCPESYVTQRCSLPLSFSPLYLSHVELRMEGGKQVVWLLCGNDQRVHLYQQDKFMNVFAEQDTGKFFPELTEVAASVLWLDFYQKPDSHVRFTAVGGDNGSVQLYHMDVKDSCNPSVLASWSVKLDGPITVVRWLPPVDPSVNSMYPSSLVGVKDIDDENDATERHSAAHTLPLSCSIIITSAIEETVCYHVCGALADEGLGKPLILCSSADSDCVLCCCVADMDMDGQLEVALGTYGQQILIYKFLSAENKFSLLKEISIGEPVLSLRYVDLTGDGVCELVVLGLHGIHILQHDLRAVAQLLQLRLEQVGKMITPRQDAFMALQAECL